MVALNKYAVCFDVDNTISDTRHRAHYVENKVPKLRQWVEFFDAMGGDTVIQPTVDMLKRYYAQGLTVILITGRPETHRLLTTTWLLDNNIPYHQLIMKNKHDVRMQAALWKAKMMGQLQDEGYVIKLAVDDEPSVREMYTAIGVMNIEPVLT